MHEPRGAADRPRLVAMKLVVLAGIVLAVGVLAAGCGEPTPESTTAPVPATTPTLGSPSPTPSGPGGSGLAGSGTAGSDGLTVRYRDPDGGLKTVRVEDFPR